MGRQFKITEKLKKKKAYNKRVKMRSHDAAKAAKTGAKKK